MDRRPQVALVTGAAQGIGRAIALALARDGHLVVVNDLPAAQGTVAPAAMDTVEQIRETGHEACAIAADVGKREDVEGLFAAIIRQFGRLDVAVANAAHNAKHRIVDTDWPTARRIIDVTMCGTFHVAQLAAQQMIQQSAAELDEPSSAGRILLIGSIHAELAIPFHGVYAMAKAATNRLCQSLAAELAPFRINVNAINPGWIDTPGERKYLSEPQLAYAAGALPWGRMGTPEEVADLAAFLVSSSANYISGAIHTIDGGLRLDNSQLESGLLDDD